MVETGCSSKRTRFSSSIYVVPQHNCLTPVPRDLMPFSEVCRTGHHCAAHTYMQVNYLHIYFKTKKSVRQDNNKSLGCKQELSTHRATAIGEHTGFLKANDNLNSHTADVLLMLVLEPVEL